jgi:hypothetical protein
MQRGSLPRINRKEVGRSLVLEWRRVLGWCRGEPKCDVKESVEMDIQAIINRSKSDQYVNKYVVDMDDMAQLVEEIEHLQFENEIIRRNRTNQERKDFNRIQQLENEIKTLKSLMKFNGQEVSKRIQELKTANDLLHLENKEYEEALKFYAIKENYECDDETLNPSVSYIHIVDMDSGEKAREALGEAIVEELNSQTKND